MIAYPRFSGEVIPEQVLSCVKPLYEYVIWRVPSRELYETVGGTLQLDILPLNTACLENLLNVLGMSPLNWNLDVSFRTRAHDIQYTKLSVKVLETAPADTLCTVSCNDWIILMYSFVVC